jgi:hypothetical protein
MRQFSITVKLAPLDGLGEPWWLSNVYGPTARADKAAFLQELRIIRANCPGPWLLCGDFNLIYKASDKNNGRIHHGLMRSFHSWMTCNWKSYTSPVVSSPGLMEETAPRWNSSTVPLPWWNGWSNTPVTKCGVSRLTTPTVQPRAAPARTQLRTMGMVTLSF